MFGHKAPGYAFSKGWGGWEYADVRQRGTDGIGRHHADIYGKCARCEKKFFVASIHVPVIKE